LVLIANGLNSDSVNQCNFDKNVLKYMTYSLKQLNKSSFVNELLSSGILKVETLDDPNIALAHLTSILNELLINMLQ